MAAATSHSAIVHTQSHRWSARNSRFEKQTSNLNLVSAGNMYPIRQQFGFGFVCASRSSVVEPVQLHSNGNSDHTPKKSSESSLILIRHGESLWNEKNLFTGCVDVPLTPKGVEEAIEAGKRICSIPIDVVPQLTSGKHVMIAAHGNSLRSIIMQLDKLTSQEVISLELSTGIPMLYIFKEGKFIRRGSPVGPSEASVYAYTRKLAQYRQKLDSMVYD
uniref:phosphoglycerate mutase (2,3-diphosphoglycerate-dependent) n=2 Tax=Oryza glumipatula TaxID=40148 RepID=A0A0E0A6Z2_9ORYZ